MVGGTLLLLLQNAATPPPVLPTYVIPASMWRLLRRNVVTPAGPDHRTLYAGTVTRSSLYAYTVIRNVTVDIDPSKTAVARK